MTNHDPLCYAISMYPYLLGKEFLSMYGILLAVGLLAAVVLFKLLCNIKKVDDKTYTFYSLLAVISIAIGMGGAALFQLFYDWIAWLQAGKIGKFEGGGLTFMGGLVAGVLTFVLGTLFFAKGKVKRDFFRCASYAAPCIVLGHIFGRLGCFCAGCCYGKPTHSKLGVVFPDLRDYAGSYPAYAATGGRAYPTQLFEALFLAVLLAVMLVLLLKFDTPKRAAYKLLLPLYGIGYAVFRFCIEFLRGDDRGALIPGLTPSQVQVIVLALVAIALTVAVFGYHVVPFEKAKDPPEKRADPPTEEDKTPPNS